MAGRRPGTFSLNPEAPNIPKPLNPKAPSFCRQGTLEEAKLRSWVLPAGDDIQVPVPVPVHGTETVGLRELCKPRRTVYLKLGLKDLSSWLLLLLNCLSGGGLACRCETGL